MTLLLECVILYSEVKKLKKRGNYMSKKEEEFHNDFFEYLMALNSIDSDADFLAQVEPLAPPLEEGFWDNLKKEEEKKESRVFLDSSGLTISKSKPSTHNRVEELEQKVQELEQKMEYFEDYVHLVMRGPKGDKGADGVDGVGFDLTEEDIKNAVRDGVFEGIKELLSEKI